MIYYSLHRYTCSKQIHNGNFFSQHWNVKIYLELHWCALRSSTCSMHTSKTVVRVAHWKFTTNVYWFGCLAFFLSPSCSFPFALHPRFARKSNIFSMENCTELLTSMHSSIVLLFVWIEAWCDIANMVLLLLLLLLILNSFPKYYVPHMQTPKIQESLRFSC